jgi:Ca2+-binding RTX toxin-like protein
MGTNMADRATIVIQPDPNGGFSLPSIAHKDLRSVDVLDVDIILTTVNGDQYILPNAGIAAMQDSPPSATFSDGSLSLTHLLGEIGSAISIATDAPMPSSMKSEEEPRKDDAELLKKIKDLQSKLDEQQKLLNQQKHTLEQQHQEVQKAKAEVEAQQDEGQHGLSTLVANSEASVEKMVQEGQKIQDNLHKSDYDYVPPSQYEVVSMSVTPPPGVAPPISMTPIVTLFMGNVVGTTLDTDVNPGYTTYYGGGGAAGSDAAAQLGPRSSMQFSAATIAAGNGNNIIYTQGPLVGNANPAADHSTYYAKEMLISVAGYFTTLDDITIKNVPAGVSIIGATDMGGGVWVLPKDYVLTQTPFVICYDTSNFAPGGNNIFDIEFNITGQTTRHATFSSKQNFRFEYMAVTDVSQVTDPTLIYDNNGSLREIYVLPTLDQPNIITAGDGNNIVYGSRSNDSITLGDGTNTITTGDGNNQITVGDGGNNLTLGDGENTVTAGNGGNIVVTGDGDNEISVGTGANLVITGAGNDTVTAQGGGGTFDLGSGSNTATITSANGSTNTYTLTTSGSGTNQITGGDNLYNITMGSGTNVVTLGDGTDAYNSTLTLGAGTNTITTGDGRHTITVGAGACSITTGGGQDDITTAGGGGAINAGAGNNTITVNSTDGSTDSYTLTTSGGGTTNITGGDDNYTITAGYGVNSLTIGDGTSSITATGAGDNTITTGNGAMTIAVGSSNNVIVTGTGLVGITAGSGNNLITTAGGGGSINAGSTGTKSIVINSTAGSTDAYTITTSGTASTTVTAGDNNYAIILGSGANAVTIGSGTSSITALGAGINTITTGDGTMTIAAGAGDNIIQTGTGIVAITSGNGDNTITTAGGGGTIVLGGGANSVTVTTGNYSIATGAGNDIITAGSGDNTINAGSGTNTIVVGGGNNTIAAGAGNDTITTGAGNNTIRAGLGTNVIAAGSGTNTMDFSDVTTALTITVGNGATHGSAIGTGINDDLLGISTIIGTNFGDTITLTGGTRTVYAGSGNDIIYCGSGTDTIYAGNGNNTIYGGTVAGFLYGGTGNNTFLTPRAGTYYNGTNGAALATIENNVAYTISNTSGTNPFANATNIPNTIAYSYAGGVATINLQLQVQLNKINYAADNNSLTINLQNGTGAGGSAQGSTYAFYTTGYNTINHIAVGNGTDYLTPSFSDTIFIGGTGTQYFYDHNITVPTQNIIIVVNGTNTNGNWHYVYAGAAHETFVGTVRNATDIIYGGSKGIVANLDSASHTFSSTLYSTPITVAAYSGSNWGANEASSDTSFSTGDYYVPVSGTSTCINQIAMNSSVRSLVYGPQNYFSFYGASGNDHFYGNTSIASNVRTLYGMSYGNDVFVGGSGFNVFYANTGYNICVILSKALEGAAATNGWISTAQYAKDNAVNLTYGGTTYDSFAYGWDNATNPATAPKTYISDVENILGYSGNDFIVGDNNGNQINARTGTNQIITGTGANIITALEGSNTIYSTGTNNVLNFATANDAYNGLMGNYSAAATAGVRVFLNATDTHLFSNESGGDHSAFFGSSIYDAFQVRTGGTSGASYSIVQSGIISTIDGGNYSSGVSNVSTNSTFTYDHVYSGASVIRGNGGASVFIDGMGSGAEAFYGGTGSNLYCVTPSQVSTVSIFNGTSGLDILRVAGWGDSVATGNAFGSNPFSNNAKFVSINVIDVRTGLDSVNALTNVVTLGANSTTNTIHPTYNLSASDIQNITDVSSTPTLALKLDSGEIFRPTGTVDAVVSGNTTTFYSSTTHTATYLIATQTHNGASYFSDVVDFNAANHARLNIHYGSG